MGGFVWFLYVDAPFLVKDLPFLCLFGSFSDLFSSLAWSHLVEWACFVHCFFFFFFFFVFLSSSILFRVRVCIQDLRWPIVSGCGCGNWDHAVVSMPFSRFGSFSPIPPS